MTAYHDLDSPQAMRADAAEAEARLPALTPRSAWADLYSAFPTDLPKPRVEIGEAARRLADALHLHLD